VDETYCGNVEDKTKGNTTIRSKPPSKGIEGLTKPSFEAHAKRFHRWRKKNWKAPKPKVIGRWFR
jgi:hypothetical protein